MRHLLLLAAASLPGCGVASGETTTVPHDQAPVVIELFTSQGCSSCPPADALLGRLAADGQSDGRPIVALSFHVDYWNDLGWADPFSTPQWTLRQQQYARALNDRTYTPELVVAGQAGMVGSQGDRVAKAIKAAPAQVAITAKGTWSNDRLTVEAPPVAGADVWVAVWEDAGKTKVTRGENSGESLLGDRVVRVLEKVPASGTVSIPLPKHASGAVAFAQKPDTRAIIGARVLAR
ncbi:MAG: DUF1223 domain-containing protein [Kofleriaceae bacterium]